MRHASPYSSEAQRGWLPWGALAPVLCIVLVEVSDLAGSLLRRPFHIVRVEGAPLGVLAFGLFLLTTFTLMGLVFVGWVRFIERRPLATIGLVRSHRIRTFLGGLAIGLGTSFAVVAAIWVSGGFAAGGYLKAFASSKALFGITALLLGFALQSSVEEIVFRGWMLSAVARKLNVPFAVFLTSLTFTLLHYDPKQLWSTTATAFLFSVFACAWALRSGNIWGVMGWHAGWNWLLAVGFEVPVTGLNAGLPALLVKLTPVGGPFLTGGAEGPEGSIWCNVVLVAATAVVLLSPRPASAGSMVTKPAT